MPDEQADALYDFLYRDSSRLSSFYAQLFGGRLTSLEHTQAEIKRESHSGKLSFGITSGDVNNQQETQSAQKKTLDPHDVVTTDVLSHLLSSNHISDSVLDAPFGSLVLSSGTLLLVDRVMFDCGVMAYDQIVKAELEKEVINQNHEVIQGWKQASPIISNVQVPFRIPAQDRRRNDNLWHGQGQRNGGTHHEFLLSIRKFRTL